MGSYRGTLTLTLTLILTRTRTRTLTLTLTLTLTRHLQWNEFDCTNPQVGCVAKYGSAHGRYGNGHGDSEWPGCPTFPALLHYFDASTGEQEFWDGTACAGVSGSGLATDNEVRDQLRPGHCISDCASGLNASARHAIETEWQARGCDAGVRAAGALRQEVRSK
jgi:hypothetical protein